MLTLNLSGRVAVVTGGSGELGRPIARALADCGAAVAVNYFKGKDRAQQVADEITRGGGRAMIVHADVADLEGVQSMRDQVKAKFGDADIIVNNSVHQYSWKRVLDQDLADYESQFRTCTLHNVIMAKVFVPAMIAKKFGRVIAINTECLMQADPTMSAYTSGKAGQDRVLRVLAREVGEHGITVNQVAPGWMISETRPDGPEADAYRAKVPLRRRGHDTDIANAVAFLASDLASFINGCYLPVCGGNVMPMI